MANHIQAPEGKDPELWEKAQKRASFKTHAVTYVIINIFLWILWYITSGRHAENKGYPWPMWTTLGWGIGLAFHFANAYIFSGSNAVEREYEKLKKRQQPPDTNN